jgi:hypothetical protein
LPQDLFVLWKDARVMFGVDLPTVDFDVKDPPPALNQFGFNACGVPNCVRQTGGFGQVVSLHTVGNADLHRLSSSLQENNDRRFPSTSRSTIAPRSLYFIGRSRQMLAGNRGFFEKPGF